MSLWVFHANSELAKNFKQNKKKITRRGARTHDHKIKSLALYQTELGGRYMCLVGIRFDSLKVKLIIQKYIFELTHYININ